jgi:hypothetical protein
MLRDSGEAAEVALSNILKDKSYHTVSTPHHGHEFENGMFVIRIIYSQFDC